MSTAAVSSTSISQQLQQYFQTRGTDLKQLGTALKNGDVAGAQTAFNNIVQLGKTGPAASGNPFLISQREQDFNAIGSALQSGDLAGAQQAFATLRGSAEKQASGNVNNGLITAPPTTGPTSPGPDIILNLTGGSGTSVNNGLITAPSSTASSPASSSTGPEIILNLGGGGGSSTNPEQITINLTQTSGGGEQVALSVGSQGSTQQQVTFNLGANSNEQIVLNLLGASSSTPSSTSTAAAGSTSSAASGGLSVTA